MSLDALWFVIHKKQRQINDSNNVMVHTNESNTVYCNNDIG